MIERGEKLWLEFPFGVRFIQAAAFGLKSQLKFELFVRETMKLEFSNSL